MVKLFFNHDGSYYVKVLPNPPHRNAKHVMTPYGSGVVIGSWIAPGGQRHINVRLDRAPGEICKPGERHPTNVTMAFPQENITEYSYSDEISLLDDVIEKFSERRAKFSDKLAAYVRNNL